MKAINLQTMDKVVSDNYDQNYPTIPNYTIHFLFLFQFYFIEIIQTKKEKSSNKQYLQHQISLATTFLNQQIFHKFSKN